MNNDFTFSKIYELSKLSKEVYDNKKHPARINIKDYDIDILYIEEDEHQTIVIEGTHNINNIISNLYFWKKKDDILGINVHSGFLKVAKKILNSLLFLMPVSKPVILTGHSMGGAVALVLGMLLYNYNYNIDNIVTFGQPKVTDLNGAEKYNHLNITRIINDNDIVPSLPSITILTFFNPYNHFGEELSIDSDIEDWWRISTGIKKIPFIKRLKLLFKLSNDPIVDHKIERYVQTLSKLK